MSWRAQEIVAKPWKGSRCSLKRLQDQVKTAFRTETFATTTCMKPVTGTDVAVPLNVKHELTRQRKWDKQETQKYMRHFNALKLDKPTSRPRVLFMESTAKREGKKKVFKSSVRI